MAVLVPFYVHEKVKGQVLLLSLLLIVRAFTKRNSYLNIRFFKGLFFLMSVSWQCWLFSLRALVVRMLPYTTEESVFIEKTFLSP
jgi:hypothetical protein